MIISCRKRSNFYSSHDVRLRDRGGVRVLRGEAGPWCPAGGESNSVAGGWGEVKEINLVLYKLSQFIFNDINDKFIMFVTSIKYIFFNLEDLGTVTV